MVALVLAIPAAALGVVVGMLSHVVEVDGRADPIDCGATLFHRGPSRSPACSATVDYWRFVAEAGLVVTAALLVLSAVLLVRSLRGGSSAGRQA